MINYDFIYYRILYLYGICALPTLLHCKLIQSVVLLIVWKMGVYLYTKIKKGSFLLQNGGSTYTQDQLIHGKIQ